MIDSATGEKVIVRLHAEYGPYIQITNYQDAAAIEDELDEMYVLYFSGPFDGAVDAGGAEYFFGPVADPVKLQDVLDKITFD